MELIREIIYPIEDNYTLRLPDAMIGKQVKVIAFEIEKMPQKSIKNDLKEIIDIFKDDRVNLSNFKFDRDEANNYED